MIRYTSNDLYIFSMKQAVWSNYPNAEVEYKFYIRDKDVDLRPYREKIEEKIRLMEGLGPRPDEIAFFRSLGWIKESFLKALEQFRIDTSYVTVYEENGQLAILIKGPWYNTIDFEVPILRAVSEAYFHDKDTPDVREEGDRRLTAKIARLWELYNSEIKDNEEIKERRQHPFLVSDFGTRRAFSESWQGHVVSRLARELPPDMLQGTSNVWFAMENGIRPQGTMAHQFVMAFQAFTALHLSQAEAFDCWLHEFRGRMGIALSDTLGDEQFDRDFDYLMASQFDGSRNDSGDPFTWCEKRIQKYKQMGINPMLKTASFTNALDLDMAFKLYRRFCKEIRPSFGIGTHLTNDLGPKALNIVIKMVRCNGIPLIKMSAERGKMTCESPALCAYAEDLFYNVLAKP